MTDTPEQGYLSATVAGFAHVISDLLGTLEGMAQQPPNEVQASPTENGYAISIVVLSCALLESTIGWAEHVVYPEGCEETTRLPATDRLQRLLSRDADDPLRDDLEEVLVQRDALMHGHLWTASIRQTDEALFFVTAPTLRPGYGDRKFRKVCDSQTRCSRRLKLNLFPTRIWRRDACVALRAILGAVEAVDEERGLSLSPRISFHAKHEGRLLRIGSREMAIKLREQIELLRAP